MVFVRNLRMDVNLNLSMVAVWLASRVPVVVVAVNVFNDRGWLRGRCSRSRGCRGLLRATCERQAHDR
jgi:hypothetical protein